MIGPTNSEECRMQALHFTRFDMSEQGSASPLFATKDAPRTGIYILEFADQARYVGQTVNIVTRYAAHRRHHGDFVALRFAPCPSEELDQAERSVIHEQEQHHQLRNTLLADLPGGGGDLTVALAEELCATLPWKRVRRTTVADECDSRRRRAWQLQARDDWSALGTTLARYVDQTVPAPITTAVRLWTVSALPTTNRRAEDHRLITLSCGRMETLYIRQLTDNGELVIGAHFNLLTDQPGFDRSRRSASRPLNSAPTELRKMSPSGHRIMLNVVQKHPGMEHSTSRCAHTTSFSIDSISPSRGQQKKGPRSRRIKVVGPCPHGDVAEATISPRSHAAISRVHQPSRCADEQQR